MKLIILCFVFILFLLPVLPMHAHMSQEEDEITIVMHAEPDDRPLANQETTLHFQIDDPSKEFKVSNCSCIVTVFRNGKKIMSKPATEVRDQKSLYSASTKIVFDQEGSYEVRLDGSPITTGEFHPLSAKFNLEVGKSIVKPKNNLGIPNYITYIFLTVIGCSTVYLVFRRISS